eukprot:6195482-Pleurochrysis_carterae.AAC.1
MKFYATGLATGSCAMPMKRSLISQLVVSTTPISRLCIVNVVSLITRPRTPGSKQGRRRANFTAILAQSHCNRIRISCCRVRLAANVEDMLLRTRQEWPRPSSSPALINAPPLSQQMKPDKSDHQSDNSMTSSCSFADSRLRRLPSGAREVSPSSRLIDGACASVVTASEEVLLLLVGFAGRRRSHQKSSR